MKQIIRHPLLASADILKRTLVLNGFHLLDDGEAPEVILPEQNQNLYIWPREAETKRIILDKGRYMLRSNLLVTQLKNMKTDGVIKEMVCGRVYDGNDRDYPHHLYIEGVYAVPDMTFKDYKCFWDKIASGIYGIGAAADIQPVTKDAFRIIVNKQDGRKVILGFTGAGSWLAKGLLDRDKDMWIFTIDVDEIAIDFYGLNGRAQLYLNQVGELKKYTDNTPAYGDDFKGKVSDVLRKMGYTEYIGPKIYPADAYIKMNMFQDTWDRNNKGVPLVEPLGDKTAIPTVLTPGLEFVLGENYAVHEQTVKIFEIAHIFLPGEGDNPPEEKTALSIGAYGPEIDVKSFKADMDEFLTEIGINNHFFIPTDVPIPYKPGECWLVLDEKPEYLGGNFGGICAIAEENFGIGIHAYMANFELAPLKEKAVSEYGFTPPELT